MFSSRIAGAEMHELTSYNQLNRKLKYQVINIVTPGPMFQATKAEYIA